MTVHILSDMTVHIFIDMAIHILIGQLANSLIGQWYVRKNVSRNKNLITRM